MSAEGSIATDCRDEGTDIFGSHYSFYPRGYSQGVYLSSVLCRSLEVFVVASSFSHLPGNSFFLPLSLGGREQWLVQRMVSTSGGSGNCGPAYTHAQPLLLHPHIGTSRTSGLSRLARVGTQLLGTVQMWAVGEPRPAAQVRKRQCLWQSPSSEPAEGRSPGVGGHLPAAALQLPYCSSSPNDKVTRNSKLHAGRKVLFTAKHGFFFLTSTSDDIPRLTTCLGWHPTALQTNCCVSAAPFVCVPRQRPSCLLSGMS